MAQRKDKVEVEFRRSLALAVVIDLSFLAIADEFEGFDQWIYSTNVAITPDLRSDIHSLFKSFANKLLFDQLLRAPRPIHSISVMIGWISGLDRETIARSNLHCLREMANEAELDRRKIDETLFSSFDNLKALLAELAPKLTSKEIDPGNLARLISNPEEMKGQIIYIVSRFWDRHYRQEYARVQEIENRSMNRLSKHDFSGMSAAQIFTEVSGRAAPEYALTLLSAARKMILIPSCHSGPYASIDRQDYDESTVSIVYNCRPSGGAGNSVAIPIAEMFPPLKALADETRLEILDRLNGRELYAQQIVDQLDISQSAVSRHLRLLVASGVLIERKHEGMKFYRINEEAIAAVTAHLRTLRKG